MKKETTKEMIIRKLTSRKLWMAVCAFVSLLVVALGHTESEAAQVTALIMAGASVLSYILAEGLTDSAHLDEGDDEETTETHAYGFTIDDDE